MSNRIDVERFMYDVTTLNKKANLTVFSDVQIGYLLQTSLFNIPGSASVLRQYSYRFPPEEWVTGYYAGPPNFVG